MIGIHGKMEPGYILVDRILRICKARKDPGLGIKMEYAACMRSPGINLAPWI